MRKGATSILAALATALLLPGRASADTWTQSNAAGFGAGAATSQSGRGLTFTDPADGRSYAHLGTRNTAVGGGVWRSSDGVSWNQLNANGFGASANAEVVGVYPNGSVLMAGVANAAGGQVWRSTGTFGATWRQVFSSATTGGAQNSVAASAGMFLHNAFYIGTENTATGAEVWKSTSADWPGAWIQSSTAGFGVGTSITRITHLGTHNGILYAATGCAAAPCGQLWKTTGTAQNYIGLDTWTQVLVASVTLDAGNNTSALSAMETFRGYSYLATARATGGAQVWRSTSPDTPGSWSQVWSPDGDGSSRFAAAGAREVRALRSFKDVILYVGTWDSGAGLVVYRSTNGVHFIRSNATAGFGDPNNQFPGDLLFTSAANGGSVVAGAANTVSGAAVWRAPLPTPEPASISAVYVSTLTVAFTAQTSTTTYQVDCATTSNFRSVLYSANVSAAGPFSATPTGLTGNTTYFIRAGAAWADAKGYAEIGSTVTLPAIPFGAGASFTSTDTITMTWAALNGPIARYQVLLSTASDPVSPGGAAVTTTAVTYSTFTSAAGLNSNTTYYFKVRAIGNAGRLSAYSTAGSTYTVPAPPGAPAQPFVAALSTAVSVGWTVGANDPAGVTVFYFAQLSTGAFPNSFAGNVSKFALSTFTTVGSLAGNTTYFLQVRAENLGGGSPFTSLGSTVTAPAVPTGVGFSGAFASSITVTWSSAGNGAGVSYSVLTSTADPSSPAGAVVTASTVYTTSLSTAGLVSNTTYFFRVAAVGNAGLVSAYSDVAQTYTDPAAPGAAAAPFPSVQVSSVTVAWTAGNPATGAALRYLAVRSTGAFPNDFAGNVSSDTANLSATFGSGGAGAALSPNTTHYFRVQAVNSGGGGEFLSIGATSTLASLASGVSFTANSTGSVQLDWSGAGNGPGAAYTVLVSTASDPGSPGGAVVTTSVTYSTSYSTAGLAADTTYFLRLAAANNNGVSTPYTAAVSTFTLPLSPAAAASLFASVQPSSLTVAWTSGANPAGGAPLAYVAELSTGAFPNSFAGNIRLSTAGTGGAFGAGGAGSSLTPSATYFVQVQAVNAGGAGAFASLGSTATLAVAPVPAAFSQPSTGSIQFNWSAAGNGAALYTVLISTAADPAAPAGAVVTASSTYGTSVSTAGLAANTAYRFRVAAANPNGLSTAYAAAAATATLALAPTGLAFAAVDSSSVTLSWAAAGNPAGTNFTARASTAAGGAVAASGNTTSTSLALTGLSANATYFFEVAAINQDGVTTAYAAALATATAAALPTSAAPTSVTNSSITANWGANGNSATTVYQAQASTDAAFGVVSAASSTLATSALLSGLVNGTTYYLRVRAVNMWGVPTTYVSLPSTATLSVPPAAPTLSAAALGTSSISWTWAAVFNSDGYRLLSTASVNVSGDLAGAATSFAEVALATNTAYARALVAFNIAGASTSTAVTRYTSAAAPTGVAITSVFVTSITLQWAAGGNPSGTTYYALAWPAGGSTTTAAVQLTSAAITGLNFSTTYFVTVQAINGDGLATGSGAALSTRTLDIPISSGTATPGAGATLVFAPPTGDITVAIPPGAFAAPVGVTVSTTPLVTAPVSAAGSTPTGVGVSITIATGQQPARAVSLTVSFRDSDVAGLDVRALTLCRYDPDRNVWIPLLSTVDPVAKTVTGLTDHLSVFQIFALTAASSVSDVRIFPNPFRPALGHGAVTFANLPAGATVKVYTVLGQLLRTLTANGAGLATWDGLTDAGQAAATGLYFVHAKGGDHKVFRLGIQR